MSIVATAPPPVPVGERLRRWAPTWPLSLLVLGFPLWWVLGLSAVMPLVLAVPMAIQLVRRGQIRVPRGSLWWALFLVWVLASALVLWVDAPGAVPGGGGLGRALVWAYRLAWYLAGTVVLLWLGNADPNDVPSTRVRDLMAWMFVITVGGGLLGTLVPRFELTSPVEALLPGALSATKFVVELVHPAAAAATSFLGYTEYRPMAPFAYANTWGANLAMSLPFFLTSWTRRDAGWKRWAWPVVLVVAVVPIVGSLNRALWGVLAAGVVFWVLRLGLRGHTRMLLGAMVVVALAAAALLASPLAEQVTERLDNAHSNDRRADLLTLTVASTAEGSPVVGFGSTRDVQGSFSSIASGSTPDCPACGVPALGTQGLLWTLIFAQGLVGAAFFLAFLVRRGRVHWRTLTTDETVALALLLFFVIQLPVYDTLGMPFFALMTGLGLAWRQARLTGREQDHVLADVLALVRQRRGRLVGFGAAGLVVGLAAAALTPPLYAAKASVLLTPVPVSVDPTTANLKERTMTVDTEAALVLSAATLSVLTNDPVEQARLRSRISITAPPNTDVLVIEFRDHDRDRVVDVAQAVSTRYLEVRGEYLALRRAQVLRALEDQLTTLQTAGREGEVVVTEARLLAYIGEVQLTPTFSGEPLRAARAVVVDHRVEAPVVSATLLGLLLGVVLVRYGPAPAPARVRRPWRHVLGSVPLPQEAR